MARSGRYVAYIRVSTAKQGASGLGLAAQRKAVETHVRAVRGDILREYQEVESGGKNARPALHEALAYAKATGATLVIAKLDRLSRSVSFISDLMDSGVDFVACDFPDANRLTLHIMAAVAEHERDAISLRTKAALAAARQRAEERGEPFKIGAAADTPGASRCRELLRRHNGGAKGREVIAARADRAAEDLRLLVDGIVADGATTLQAVADELTRVGAPTRRGGRWGPQGVKNLLGRLGVTLPRAA